MLASATGGALGAVARWALTATFPAGAGQFPWATCAINVGGSALLALLGLLPAVRHSTWWPVFLGTGVLGGFTTMSAASVDTVVLFDHGASVVAVAYCAGTMLAAVGAAWVLMRIDPVGEHEFEIEEGDR